MTAAPARPALSNRLGWGLALGIAVLVAGVVSRWASSDPDGLERVAEDHDLAGHALERVGLLSYDGPSALIGVGVVLVLATGLAMVVRHRGR